MSHLLSLIFKAVEFRLKALSLEKKSDVVGIVVFLSPIPDLESV